MQKLNNLSTKSVILISFLLGVLIGGSALFYVTYSPFTQASNQEIQFEATAYEDLVRFKAEGSNISKVQVEIYDLSGRRIYKGETMRQALDWHRTTDKGERLTKGTYLYVTKAFNQNNLVKTSGIGKMFIGPDLVKLKSAPSLGDAVDSAGNLLDTDQSFRTMAVDENHLGESWAFGKVGIGTDNFGGPLVISSPDNPDLNIIGTEGADYVGFRLRIGNVHWRHMATSKGRYLFRDVKNSTNPLSIQAGTPTNTLSLSNSGNVGIGTDSPEAALEVRKSSSNLLALYDPTNSSTSAKFIVEDDGTVRADGTYYGADFVTGGGADVAERINTSEWVEKGNVVEIDPKHEGFFRKANSSYSKKVAGVISSNPGVILGNDNATSLDKWKDNRPMLALVGRIPVKANIENGSIAVGDLLVSSSQPGYAMKCKDQSKCSGAIVGKALEPLEEESGKIMTQVSLS